MHVVSSVLHVLVPCISFLSRVFIKLMLVDQMGHRFNLKGTSCNSVHSVSTGVLIEDELRSSDSVKTFGLITSPVTLNRAPFLSGRSV